MTDTAALDHATNTGPEATGPTGAPDRSDRRRASRKRLVVEVSSDLHQRILTICATRGVPVNQAVRAVLDRAFPGQ